MKTSKLLKFHNVCRLEGLRKIVHDFPIVKPKVERIQLSHGIKPEDIKDFVGEKEFL